MIGIRKIAIQTPAGVSDGQGGFIDGWAHVSDERGRIRPATGRELVAAEQARTRLTHVAYLRSSAPIKPGDRLESGDKFYDVHVVRIPGGRGLHCEIDCSEIQS